MYIESHPRRFVSPSPRHLCGRCLPRPGRGVSVYPARPERGRRDRSFSFVFPNLQLSTFDFQPSPSSNSFPCHTSENSPVSPIIATDAKTYLSKSCTCHTSETPRGKSCLRRESKSLCTLIGRSLRTGLGVSLHAFLSTFNCRPLLFCSSTGPVHFAVQSGGRRKDGEMNERHKGQGNALTRRTLTRLECAARR